MQEPAPYRQWIAASSLIAIVLLLTVGAALLGRTAAPVALAFLPIVATLWASAYLLTALLFFSQFVVTGLMPFAYAGAAYALTGALTVPYLAFYPNVFLTQMSLSFEQRSLWLWVIWHLTFPLVLCMYHLYDRRLGRRILDHAAAVRMLKVALTYVIVATLVLTAIAEFAWAVLPTLVNKGHYTALFTAFVAPLVAAVNLLACAVIFSRSRKPSLLQLWIGVVLIISACEVALLGLAGNRYDAAWYVAQLETLLNSGIILAVLLREAVVLYAQSAETASIDRLTGLRNRRTFDEYVIWSIDNGHRNGTQLAFLVVDVDFFKQYNERFGQSAGDACLTRIAHVLRSSLARSVDIVGRSGGEEFVALLPATSSLGAYELARRIKSGVEALQIPHPDSSVAQVVTVSIGIAHAAKLDTLTPQTLFNLGDRALLQAKERRNSIALAEQDPTAVSTARGSA